MPYQWDDNTSGWVDPDTADWMDNDSYINNFNNMAYGNNNNNYGNNGGGNNRSYNNNRGNYQRNNNNGGGGYNNGGGYQNNNQRSAGKKHSGAKSGINRKGSQEGKQHITAWNFSRSRGLISLIATSYSGTREVKSKSGRIWHNWMVSWTNKKTMQKGTCSGLYDPQSGKLIINDFGWVVNPRAPHGGYCGKFTNS